MHFEMSSKALEKAQSAGATLKGLMERVLEDTLSMQTSEEASGEAATTGPTFLEEIIATTPSGEGDRLLMASPPPPSPTKEPLLLASRLTLRALLLPRMTPPAKTGKNFFQQ